MDPPPPPPPPSCYVCPEPPYPLSRTNFFTTILYNFHLLPAYIFHTRAVFVLWCQNRTSIKIVKFLFAWTDIESVRHKQKAIRKLETRGQVKCTLTMKDTEATDTAVISYALAIPLRHSNSPTFSTEMRGHSDNKHDYCNTPRPF